MLIPVSTQTQQAWLPDVTGCVWGVVRELWQSQSAAREIGKQWAQAWLQLWGYEEHVSVELAADFKVGDIRTQVLVWPVSWAPQTRTVVTVAQCKDDMLRALIAPALIKAMIMVGTPIDAATLNAAHGVGAVPPMRLESEELASVPDNTQEFWENGLAKMEAAHHALVVVLAVLQDVSAEHDCYQSVAIEWVDRISSQSLRRFL